MSPVNHSRDEKRGQHAKDGTTTNFTIADGGNGGLSAERVHRELIEEVVADEDGVLVRRMGISGLAAGAGSVGVAAEYTYRCSVRTCTNEAVEAVNNGRILVVSEIRLENPLVSTIFLDIFNTELGHPCGFVETVFNGFNVAARAEDTTGPELYFALGDVGDGNGDGMGVGSARASGIGGGPGGVVKPDDLEPRDRVEGESPRAAG